MSDNKRITVERTINASSDAVFDVLSNPARHPQLDGSGFIRSDEGTNRIQGTGDVFTMNMSGDHMGGDYQTENHVVGYDRNHLVAWKTAPAGSEPPGWEWVWELTADGPDSTELTLTYDWSAVGKDFRKQVPFPPVSQKQMEDSLANLASA